MSYFLVSEYRGSRIRLITVSVLMNSVSFLSRACFKEKGVTRYNVPVFFKFPCKTYARAHLVHSAHRHDETGHHQISNGQGDDEEVGHLLQVTLQQNGGDHEHVTCKAVFLNSY